METKPNNCPYCNSKLKRDGLKCHKCGKRVIYKEVLIVSNPRYYLILLFIPLIIMVSILLFHPIFDVALNDFVIFGLIYVIGIWGLCACLMIPANKIANQYFLISDEIILISHKRVLTLSDDVVIFKVRWKEVQKVELIQERDLDDSILGYENEKGLKIKFILNNNQISLRFWRLKFRESRMNRIAILIKEYSEYLNKEVIELEDLDESKWKKKLIKTSERTK